MKVGDLVHNPRYSYWGLGMIVDLEEEPDGMILVHWCGTGTLRVETGWCDQRDLEVL